MANTVTVDKSQNGASVEISKNQLTATLVPIIADYYFLTPTQLAVEYREVPG